RDDRPDGGRAGSAEQGDVHICRSCRDHAGVKPLLSGIDSSSSARVPSRREPALFDPPQRSQRYTEGGRTTRFLVGSTQGRPPPSGIAAIRIIYESFFLASSGRETLVDPTSLISTVVRRLTSTSRLSSPTVILPWTLNSYLASRPSLTQNF